jgi:hypothetical protein
VNGPTAGYLTCRETYEISTGRALIFRHEADDDEKMALRATFVQTADGIAADRNPDFPQKAYRRINICHPLTATASVGKAITPPGPAGARDKRRPPRP